MKRFAFYGRVSTEDQQDPTSSRNWQLARARQVIEPPAARSSTSSSTSGSLGRCRGSADRRPPGCSRRSRTRDRGFDGVVIGEPQRAFYGNQFGLTFPVFVHYGVGLWVPEVGGAVDPGSDAHDLVMSPLRRHEQRRTQPHQDPGPLGDGRARPPSKAASSAAARPTATSSPTPARTRTRAKPPSATAPPPRARPGRRTGRAADLRRVHRRRRASTASPTVSTPTASSPRPRMTRRATAIGQRPRHLGEVRRAGHPRATPATPAVEVWNKQRKDEVLIDVDDVALGHETKHALERHQRLDLVRASRPTSRSSPTDAVRGRPGDRSTATHRGDGSTRRSPAARYLLAGLMRCGVCGRRMQGHWNHGRAYYRCKFRDDVPRRRLDPPTNIYVQEAAVVPGLDAWLASLFDDDHIDQTCATLAGASEPDPDADRREADLSDRHRRLRPQARATTEPSSTPTTTVTVAASGSPTPNANAKPSNAARPARSRAASSPQARSRPWSTRCATSSTCSPMPTRRTRPSSTTSSVSRPDATTLTGRVRARRTRVGYTCVSEGGLEPPRPCGHQPLKLARLPIPPLRRGCQVRLARGAS